MQGIEDTDLQALFTGPPEHGPDGSTEQGTKQRPVAVGQNVALLRHLLLRGFEATGTAGFRLTALAKNSGSGGSLPMHSNSDERPSPRYRRRACAQRRGGSTVSRNLRNKFQPSSMVKSNFAGRGIYMPQSIKCISRDLI